MDCNYFFTVNYYNSINTMYALNEIPDIIGSVPTNIVFNKKSVWKTYFSLKILNKFFNQRQRDSTPTKLLVIN